MNDQEPDDVIGQKWGACAISSIGESVSVNGRIVLVEGDAVRVQLSRM